MAERTAREQAQFMPFYTIGTEVPPPGGADHKLCELTPATPIAVRKTIEIHRQFFEQAGLADAFARVIGLVIQPGVEFGNHNVIRYDRAKAKRLAHILTPADGLVFEAHSTDYQGGIFAVRARARRVRDPQSWARAHLHFAGNFLRVGSYCLRPTPRVSKPRAQATDGLAYGGGSRALEWALLWKRRGAKISAPLFAIGPNSILLDAPQSCACDQKPHNSA